MKGKKGKRGYNKSVKVKIYEDESCNRRLEPGHVITGSTSSKFTQHPLEGVIHEKSEVEIFMG